jgi:hypothetical protein
MKFQIKINTNIKDPIFQKSDRSLQKEKKKLKKNKIK